MILTNLEYFYQRVPTCRALVTARLLHVHLRGLQCHVREAGPSHGLAAGRPPEVERAGGRQPRLTDGDPVDQLAVPAGEHRARELKGLQRAQVLRHPCMHLERQRRRQEAPCTQPKYCLQI